MKTQHSQKLTNDKRMSWEETNSHRGLRGSLGDAAVNPWAISLNSATHYAFLKKSAFIS